ncbi:hypothetical protein BCR33DRAFT_308190 [Rhizoclosmatium globosum]|uniref:Uncharacterized protein n=1 Tax=Rhizoclosmatium globosum TaxID=329046 RepID=A0A1Y2C5L9_9FUNG|nr:hypothetical protein BCR33DRAFT_308190 [Rhizoclosmatium globosum]|eukprot:ORY42329.1 hypothetical protein BCR33DRAFT_308190 [Rhizoclosmatium globosum]
MFRQDSANSFMYGGITGARADSTDEIRSNSQIGSRVPSQYASQTSVAGAVASSEKVGHGGTKLREEILEEGGRESDVVGGGQNEVDEKAREDEGVEGVIDQRELAPQQGEPDLQYESEQEPEMAETHYLDHNTVEQNSEPKDFEHEESQGHVAQELKDENAEPQAVSELKKSLHSLSASLTKLAEGAQSASVKGSRATLVQSEENKTATEPATSIWDDIFSFASNAPVRSSRESK